MRNFLNIGTTLLTILIIFSLSAVNAGALTPTSSPKSSPTPQSQELLDKLKQIEILKEKIATRVAKVRDETKGALFGKIVSIEKNGISLNNTAGEHQFTFSEDTLVYKLENSKKTEVKTSDLKPGFIISTFGNFAPDVNNLLSKFIYIQERLERVTGKIADIDKSNFTITVKAKDGDKIIDIEKYTVITFFEKGKGSQKGGFSKFKTGDLVFIMSVPNSKEENRFSALRIIDLPSPLPTPTSTPQP